MTKKNIGIFFGGKSEEHEVSLRSAKAIAENIDLTKFHTYFIYISKEGNFFLKKEISSDKFIPITLPLGEKPAFFADDWVFTLDAAFPVLHGPYGEDGKLQGFLETLNIKYVGSKVLGSSTGMDKITTKKLAESFGVKTAPFHEWNFRFQSIPSKDELRPVFEKLGPIVFVKPSNMGSSVGVEKCETLEEFLNALKKASHFDSRVLAEKAIVGREIEIAVFEKKGEIQCTEFGEVIPDEKIGFYTYDAKYTLEDGAKLVFPAEVDQTICDQAKKICKKLFSSLDLSHLSRIDFFLTPDNQLYLNEVNTLPGFTSISMYPKLFELKGVSFKELITSLIEAAIAE